MRIRTKIFALVGTLGFVALGIAGVAISTLQRYNEAVAEQNVAADRALYSERLNRLVTAVVMESRGVYISQDAKEARKFADGLLAALKTSMLS